MEDYMRSQNLIQSEDTVLAIEIVPEDGQMWCGYYFACSSTRHVFWLDRMNLSEAAGEFRFHWDFFPQVNDVTEDVYDLVLNALADARTGPTSSSAQEIVV
ncbi:hypothetical protein H0H93_006415 [Arthromyces matolae]|nr:hypothetical protein H0H93_006415 [Arthromyces matolae]